MFLAGLLSALGLLLLIFKLGIRRIIAYDIVIDIAVTSLLMLSLAGTYSGMIAALTGGLFVSIVLWVLKRTITREELHLTAKKVRVANRFDVKRPDLQWVAVNPHVRRSSK